ncbi:glycosyltransferase family 2 protein [Candidatus Sumerlaeota bacterium]|nr:glycosyltransferase family 2 protein [Candidatus Sumerlaeota bacterium]
MATASRGTAVVVVSFDGADLLRTCLPAILDQDLPFARVLLVDNASADETRAYAESLPDVECVALDRNLGFAGGANRGIERALADAAIDAVALVNNDVVLEPGWHRAARSVLLSRDDCGSCATCLLKADDPNAVDSAGIEWVAPGVADNYLHGQPVPPPEQSPREIAGACAGAALYRREALEQIGLFDESLFAYQEDVDWALRSAARGYVCLFAPGARGVHRGHASNRRFPLGGTWGDYYNARNRPVVLAQSLPSEEWRRRWFAILRNQAALLTRSPVQGRFGAVASGFATGIVRALNAWRRRVRRASRDERGRDR